VRQAGLNRYQRIGHLFAAANPGFAGIYDSSVSDEAAKPGNERRIKPRPAGMEKRKIYKISKKIKPSG